MLWSTKAHRFLVLGTQHIRAFTDGFCGRSRGNICPNCFVLPLENPGLQQRVVDRLDYTDRPSFLPLLYDSERLQHTEVGARYAVLVVACKCITACCVRPRTYAYAVVSPRMLRQTPDIDYAYNKTDTAAAAVFCKSKMEPPSPRKETGLCGERVEIMSAASYAGIQNNS